MDRKQLLPLLQVLGLAVYWFAVIAPISGAIDSAGVSGSRTKETLEGEVAEMRKALTTAKKKLGDTEESLRQEVGTLRFTGAANRTPLDALLNAIEESCRESAAVLRTMAPTPKVRTGVLEQEGLLCQIELAQEEQFQGLLNLLREKGRSRNAMIHNLAIVKQAKGYSLAVSFGILRKVQDPDSTKEKLADLETFLAIQRERAPYSNSALLEPRPAVAAQAPKPAKSAAEKASEKPKPVRPRDPPPPSAPAFSGKLLGLGASGGKDAAILDTGGGKPEIVEQGEKVGGWTVQSISESRVVMQRDSSTQVLYFSEEEKPGAGPESEQASEAPKPIAGAPSLGFQGAMEPLAEGETLPAPLEKMKRVFVVGAVADGGLAERAGLRPGDRILAIDGKPLRVPDQLLGLRARLGSGHVGALEISRNRSIVQVALNP